MHKLVCKDFEIKNWGKYNDFSTNFDTLLLADLFENFRKTCLEIYQLDPDKFLSAPGLPCQVTLKKTEVEIGPLTDIDMVLMVEKGNKEGICPSINRYAKANNKH